MVMEIEFTKKKKQLYFFWCGSSSAWCCSGMVTVVLKVEVETIEKVILHYYKTRRLGEWMIRAALIKSKSRNKKKRFNVFTY